MPGRNTGTIVAILILLTCIVSCRFSQPKMPSTVNKQANAYFDDSDVVALCDAISKHDLPLIKKNLNETTATTIGKQGMTPLLWALLEENPEAVQLLLRAGADPHVFVEGDFGARKQGVFKGVAPIHVAAGKEDASYLKMFLENGADANLVDKDILSETPIFFVVNRVDRVNEHVELLVKYGANLELQGSLGRTTPAIHAAITLRRFDVARVLLENGANPLATTNGNTRLIHLLLRDRTVSRISPQQKPHYDALLKWLDDHGESIAQAKKEVATGEY